MTLHAPFHRPRPRFGDHGQLLGFVRACSYAETDGAGALGKEARFDDDGPTARITDVIFELDSGEILAYEFTTERGAAYYLPATARQLETARAVKFRAHARAAAVVDLADLGSDLSACADRMGEDGEFVTFEVFPEVD